MSNLLSIEAYIGLKLAAHISLYALYRSDQTGRFTGCSILNSVYTDLNAQAICSTCENIPNIFEKRLD